MTSDREQTYQSTVKLLRELSKAGTAAASSLTRAREVRDRGKRIARLLAEADVPTRLRLMAELAGRSLKTGTHKR